MLSIWDEAEESVAQVEENDDSVKVIGFIRE